MPKVKDTITTSLNRIEKKMLNVPRKAYKYWLNITPKDTGNAKRKTKLKKNTISAGYDYASYLDNGHSKQAKDGMSKPTKKYIDKLVKSIIRK